MVDASERRSDRHASSIILALLLFIFGEKSFDVAKLGLCAFDALFKEGCVSNPYAYEISLVGLAIGSCLVITLSWSRQEQLKNDNLVILAGLLTATIAAMINILDAAIFGDEAEYAEIPKRAMFFFVIWVWLFILPIFTRVIDQGEDGRVDLSATVLSAAALVTALLMSICVRFASGTILLYVLDQPDIASRDAAFDRLIYRSDMLIMIGAIWFVATFHPSRHLGQAAWRAVYLTAAFTGGFIYGLWVSPPNDLILAGLSALHVALGFGMLSLAAVMPSAVAPEAVFEGRWQGVLLCALATFAACAIVMYAGLTTEVHNTVWERTVLALLQGMAGALVPVSVATATHALRWRRFGFHGRGASGA